MLSASTITFFTTQGDDDSGWEVVKKTFPSPPPDSISISTDVLPEQHFADQKMAQLAAHLLAESNKCPYVNANENVITVLPIGNRYVLISLEATNGNIIGGLGSFGDVRNAIAAAKDICLKNKTLFMSLFEGM